MIQHIDSQAKKDALLAEIVAMPIDGSHEGGIKKLSQTRTAQQRKAIEVYCRELALAFNGAGFSVQEILSKTMDCDWTQEMVKDAIFKKATGRVLDKKSTTEISSEEVTLVYDTVNRFASQFGIHVPFPQKKERK